MKSSELKASRTITSRDIFGNEYQIPVDQLKWSHSAYAVIIRDGHILLNDQAGGYNLPGGTINLGEPPEVTVLREVTEETGITAANPRLLTALSNFFTWKDPRGDEAEHYQSFLFYYACEYVSGQFSKAGHEGHEQALGVEPQWVPLDKLGHIKVGSSVNWLELIRPLL